MTHNPPTNQPDLDAIQARIDAASPGPWRRPLNTRYKHTVTAPLPDDERGSYLDGIDPVTGEREQCTVATIPIWSNGKHSRQRGGRDLEYIAAMSPDVAAALIDEVRRLRAELAAGRAQAWRDLADRADPQRPEISFFGDHGHEVGAWMRMQAEYEDRNAAVRPAVETGA